MRRNRFFQPLMLSTVLAVGFAVVWIVVSWWAYDVMTGKNVYPRWPQVGPPGQVGLPAVLRHTARATGSSRERICSFRGGSRGEYWYFVSDGQIDGNGYFVGYDRWSKVCVGYLGTAGFRHNPLPRGELIPGARSRMFAMSRIDNFPSYDEPSNLRWLFSSFDEELLHDVYVLGRDQKIYHADLWDRTVEILLDGQRVHSIGFLYSMNDSLQKEMRRFLGEKLYPVVRTDDAVLVLDKGGQVHRRYPIPEALQGLDFAFSETETGEAMMHWVSLRDELATKTEHRLFWITSGGQVQREETILPAKITLPMTSWLRPLNVPGVVPAPVVLGYFIGTMGGRELLDRGWAATLGEALSRALTEFWPALAIAQLIAIGFAVLCYRRQVRYGMSGSERLIWPLFVLLFGLPGWIGYRFGRSWPVLETCPACEAIVPRDREACAFCANEFTRPAFKGTEVVA